jgi:hypothetical protein
MTALPPFQLNVMSPTSEMTTGPTSQPAGIVLCLDDLCTQDPATSWKPESFNYDCENSHFPHEWSNMAEFEVWRWEEELAYSIEFIAAHVVRGDGLWTLRCHYVCSCQLSGGKVPYQKNCQKLDIACRACGWSTCGSCTSLYKSRQENCDLPDAVLSVLTS